MSFPVQRLLTLAALGLAIAAQPATAAILTPDTAVASSEFPSGNAAFAAVNTINGSGLTDFGGSNGHADYSANPGNHWTTDGSPVIGSFITWGFSSAVSLSAMYVWNHRSNIIANNSGYDVTLFDLVLRDAGGAALETLLGVALAPNTDLRQTVSFATTVDNVRSVTFTVRGTERLTTPFTGLAEVRFEGTLTPPPPPPPPTVPLPAAGWMLLAGIGGLAALRRRRG